MSGKATLGGLDLGTNTSVLQMNGPKDGANGPCVIHRTVVGYAKDGILPGVLPDGRATFYGEEAIANRLYLDLAWPVVDGFVKEIDATRDFLKFLRSGVPTDGEFRCVIGCPAKSSLDEQTVIRRAAAGVFDKVFVAPEPFLSALGARDEARVGKPGYIDPVKNSLFIDIGAGTSDLCIIQGYYPRKEDQIRLTDAGNRLDEVLIDAARRTYPDVRLSPHSVTSIKEANSFVGTPPGPVKVDVMVMGKARTVDLSDAMRQACETLINRIIDAAASLIEQSNPEGVEEMLQNIIVTGGGSQIRQLGPYIAARLGQKGFGSVKVHCVQDYKALVAAGAVKMAPRVKEENWQIPLT
ncbi:MAG: rod shape-determining protein [Planctomycetes bacterium]|nr:rod shape-determining protein [Planctomycetota bacterium]